MRGAVRAVLAVVLVVDGDEPYLVQGKVFLNVIPRVDGVASQPGQVLHDNAVDLAQLDVLQHFLEACPLKGPAGNAVVGVDLRDLNVRAESQVSLLRVHISIAVHLWWLLNLSVFDSYLPLAPGIGEIIRRRFANPLHRCYS